MNSAECDKFGGAIEELALGRFDAIGAEEMADVEAHLNACAACSSRLGVMRAGPEAVWDEPVQLPSSDEWTRVGQAIEDAYRAERRSGISAGPIRLARRWGAIAAILLLSVSVWRFGVWGVEPAWSLQLARGDEVEITSLEVFGDAMPFVISAGEDGDVPVIWVIQNEDS